jgi:hypothetical protein
MGIRGYQRVQDYFSVDRVKERIQIAYRKILDPNGEADLSPRAF